MREFHLGPPADSTKQRIKEVQFYLIVQHLKRNLTDSFYLDNILENMSLLFKVKHNNINFAITQLETIVGKPSHLDLVIAHKYLKIPMRKLTKFCRVSSTKLYTELENYIVKGAFDLHPVLSENIVVDLEKFNEGFSRAFESIGHWIKVGGSIYD